MIPVSRRNSFAWLHASQYLLHAPRILTDTLQMKTDLASSLPDRSPSRGMWNPRYGFGGITALLVDPARREADIRCLPRQPRTALIRHITEADPQHFQPMNVTMSIPGNNRQDEEKPNGGSAGRTGTPRPDTWKTSLPHRLTRPCLDLNC
jgi:folate-dependent tRNA-U54 methylase TrmFO/GidA